MIVPMLTAPELRELGVAVPTIMCAFQGGSRTIVDPAPTNTDRDIVIHVGNMQNATEYLKDAGFEYPDAIAEYAGGSLDFVTMRKGEINVMLFSSAYEFGAVWGATSYAKSVNMKVKKDRYDFFERVRAPWRNLF